jgi:hypothetical protein
MKFSREARYPHPVLDSITSDYTAGDFVVDFSIQEGNADGNVKFEYNVSLTEPSLYDLQGKSAEVFVLLNCKDTYFTKLIPLKEGRAIFEVEGEFLHGKILLQPLFLATSKIENFTSKNLHEEFSISPWAFKKTDVLAVGDSSTYSIGHDKLAPIVSIFEFTVKEEVDDFMVMVDMEEAFIEIYISEKTLEMINGLRARSDLRAVVLNSIYLPAVTEVLVQLKLEEPRLSEKYWYKSFKAQCDLNGLDIENDQAYEMAQKLLGKPIRHLENFSGVYDGK